MKNDELIRKTHRASGDLILLCGFYSTSVLYQPLIQPLIHLTFYSLLKHKGGIGSLDRLYELEARKRGEEELVSPRLFFAIQVFASFCAACISYHDMLLDFEPFSVLLIADFEI